MRLAKYFSIKIVEWIDSKHCKCLKDIIKLSDEMIDNINNLVLNYLFPRQNKKYAMLISVIWKIEAVLHIHIIGKFPSNYVHFQLLKCFNLMTFFSPGQYSHMLLLRAVLLNTDISYFSSLLCCLWIAKNAVKNCYLTSRTSSPKYLSIWDFLFLCSICNNEAFTQKLGKLSLIQI